MFRYHALVHNELMKQELDTFGGRGWGDTYVVSGFEKQMPV